MRRYMILLMLCFASSYSYAQDTIAIKRDALKLMNALKQSDYATFADYTHPNVHNIMGGKEKMIEATKSAMDQAASKGMNFRAATLGAVGKFIPSGNEIYCTIPDTIVMNYEGGYADVPSTLLGISADQGKNWTFISTGTYPRETIIKFFPNLPKDIVIAPQGRIRVHKD
ncbi:hypothetical protein [Pedobacter foliorum]|uniref:hypothetical protein n=1 Tax=Pedobacter foliorum TaxID=2739058 RepID=UPI00156455EA|nr:hypothetical protein [Pedobacter foliorum]NRF37559.1 hypothetical protein [Pedobacter foliorum]